MRIVSSRRPTASASPISSKLGSSFYGRWSRRRADGRRWDMPLRSNHHAFLIVVNGGAGAVHFSVPKRVGRFGKERTILLSSHLDLLDRVVARLEKLPCLFLERGRAVSFRSAVIRSSNTLAGSSFGSCGTSSPRNALASMAWSR